MTEPVMSRSQVTWKTAFTVCFAAVATGLLVLFAYVTRFAIALTLIAALFAVALDHVVGALQRTGIKRGLAAAIVIVGALLVLGGLAVLVIPSLVTQAKALVEQAPQLFDKFRQSHFLQFLSRNLGTPNLEQKAEGQSQQIVQGAAKPLLTAVGGALSVVAALAYILFLTIFSLLFGGRLVQAALAETRPDRREHYLRVVEKIYRSVGGYILGLLFICTTNAVLTTTFLALTHMPFFLPLGVMSGMSSLIPYAGPIVMGSAITLVALGTGGVWKAVFTAGYFILYGQLEGHILGPLVWKRTVHISPLLTLASVLFFGELGGVLGAVLAVPTVATCQIIVRELLAIRRAQLNLAPEPEPAGGGPSPEPIEHEGPLAPH